jgi:Flp pilus assembly protein CpaB
MSRRGRATAFIVAALACAMLAAGLAAGYGARYEDRYGPLRPVVVAGHDLDAGRAIGVRAAERLQVRRVPVRFLPPGAIANPAEAIGRVPSVVVPRGSYLLASQLEQPGAADGAGSEAGPGRSPVEIAVAGGGALTTAGPGATVDVVVTTEPEGGASGRTYVAARGVRLLELREDGEAAGGPGSLGSPAAWTATLALTRGQALGLIAAESFARQIRLLPVP